MKHLFRFHANRSAEGEWTLESDEWHHLLKVLRLAAGTSIELCDGKGWSAFAEIASIGKQSGSLSIMRENFQPARSNGLTIAIGVLKPQTLDEILPSLVELDVQAVQLVPYQGMDRGRIQPKLLERWHRIVVAAGKQCKASWFTELKVHKSFSSFLEDSQDIHHRFSLDPFAAKSFNDLPLAFTHSTLVLIGSEQGWSDEESAQLLTGGFVPVRLQGHILRASTAAVAAAAMFRQKLS